MSEFLVLTDRRYAGDGGASTMPEEYIANVLEEDRLVVDALNRAGVPARRVAWCDNSVLWAATSGALFRTTWDYFDRWEEFSQWLRSTSEVTELHNSAELVHWNLDKHYLHDLHQAGVNVVPTAFVARQEAVRLKEVASQHGWQKVVIKPAVAGAARDTYVVDFSGSAPSLYPKPSQGLTSDNLWAALVEKQDMLVQPFLQDVVSRGEVSVVWLDGHVTHAVMKRAKTGDFRVQDDHGGTVQRIEATPELERTACDVMQRALSFSEARGWDSPLYARVDMMRGSDGQLLLSELEMVEPELWFRFCPEAADVLAQAVRRRVAR
ncbi:MAG: ATP-grasp domain-containing protein [Flavobacteriales bacterium]